MMPKSIAPRLIRLAETPASRMAMIMNMAESGIAAAIDQLDDKRVKLEHMDRRGYQKVGLKNGVALQQWEFYKPALDADRLINLPIAKDHSISTLTLGMKNIMGVIGGNRGVLHRNIDEALADINSVMHSDLTIIDATRILVDNGPQGGTHGPGRLPDTHRQRSAGR